MLRYFSEKATVNSTANSSANSIGLSQSGYILFLGLLFILLAFFILLNALSVFEQKKTGAVMRSINTVFNPVDISPRFANKKGIEDVQAEEIARIFDDIVRIWQTAIPMVEIDTRINQRQMRVRVPVSLFFQQGKIKIRPAHAETIIAIAEMLSRDFLDKKLTTEITMGLDSLLDFKQQKDAKSYGENDLTVGTPLAKISTDRHDQQKARSKTHVAKISPKLRLIAVMQALLAADAPVDKFAVGIQRASPEYLYFDFKIAALPKSERAGGERDLP